MKYFTLPIFTALSMSSANTSGVSAQFDISEINQLWLQLSSTGNSSPDISVQLSVSNDPMGKASATSTWITVDSAATFSGTAGFDKHIEVAGTKAKVTLTRNSGASIVSVQALGKATLKTWPTSVSPSYLPRVGPFNNLAPVDISTLSDITYAANASVVSSRTSPIMGKTITIKAGKTITSDTWAHWFWCDTLIMESGSHLSCNGTFAGVADGGPARGGSGGSGGSGGGGGSALENTSAVVAGGMGEDGFNGTAGQAGGDGIAGAGGSGFGSSYAPVLTVGTYTFPTGGAQAGSCGTAAGPWGVGGNGGGAETGCAVTASAGGGGGGGGGLICVVARTIISTDGSWDVIGGGGGDASASTNGGGGQGGSGGVLLLFARTYDGLANSINVNVQGGLGEVGSSCLNNGADGLPGTYVSYEIDHAGTATLNTYPYDFSQGWDNS